MPQRNDRSRSTPTTSPKNNSWFRMQAGHQSDADIYIYDEIGFWGVTAKQFISDLNALGDITHINLHINSPGGDVFEGIAIFNALKTHGASITVYVDGVAASMASVIAMVGNPVIMPENTFMMIHKPFGFTGGDAEDMRTYADLLDKVEAVLLPAYAQKTGKTTDEIAAMLADETWMSGAECLAHGFADQVTPAVKAMACIQSKRTEEFKKMPESIRNMITPPRNSAPRVQDDEPAASRTPVQAAAPVVDENSIRAQVLAEQKARVNGINDLFAMFGGRYQTLQAQCLADPECSLEQAREKLLNEMGRESTPSNKNTPAHIYAGNGNFVGDGIRQALMARAGFEKTERDNVYNGMTLREYARMSLTERGIGVSNLHGMVTGMAEDLQSLVGGTVVRRKVYARFLDAVNFVNGNSDADPEQEVISRWRIEQCSELSAVSASFVLSTPTETDGAVFPGRIMLANTCTWTYRGDECGYHGPAVADEYDQPTSDITKDKCSKCLSGCKFRNNVGNFGGFLSINKLSQ